MTRTLQADQRGAIILLGVFMAVFATAALYYVVGIGEAIWQRERMQDAADAAAFSAAMVHARGMNLLALINMVMAALLAVLVALKLIETLATIAVVAVGFASFLEPGLAEFIPDLDELRQEAKATHDKLQPWIDNALETLHEAGVGVRVTVPAACELPVVASVASHYRPPAKLAFAVPPRASLPTQDGTFSELCDRASSYVKGTTQFAMSKVVPGPIAHIVAGAVDDLTRAGADWFCGAGGSKPPTTSVTDTAHYPTMPSRAQCMELHPSQQDYESSRFEALCAQAEQDEAASEPDAFGRCVRSCGAGELYEQRDALARKACEPSKAKPNLRAFDWQERRFSRSYGFHAGVWAVVSDTEAEERTAHYTRPEKADARPCGIRQAKVSPEWEREPRASDGTAQPLCSNAAPPPWSGREGETVVREHAEVTHLFGCSEEVHRNYDLGKHASVRLSDKSTRPGRSKVPQDMIKSAELGEEDFQLRAVVFGSLPVTAPERVLEAATWRANDGSQAPAFWSAARDLGVLSFAQAEYFYAVEHPEEDERESYLWSMRWQARLRRFRLPETKPDNGSAAAAAGATPGVFQKLCAAAAADAQPSATGGASPCKQLDLSISDLIVH
jgi:hypothetical protein